MTSEASDDQRPRLLFLVPILPAPAGNGLAMRAGMFLDALAKEHRVTVWIVPVAGGRLDSSDPWVGERAERTVVAPLILDPLWRLTAAAGARAAGGGAIHEYPGPALTRFATAPAIDGLRATLPESASFDALLVMRSYLAPFALPLLRAEAWARGRAVLDLDDDESLTRERLATLLEVRGDAAAAAIERAEARKFEKLERAVLPAFERVLVCHERHADALRARSPGVSAEVVPNAVTIPSTQSMRAPSDEELRLLLVGNLSYLPNQDAAEIAAREVLPRIRGTGRAARLRIVGSAPSESVRALASAGSVVEVHADVPDIAPHYAWADVALAPIRAGGGTRIKLLEAFAYRVPVVATSLAAEGLDVEDHRHLLLGDSPDQLAAACVRLDREPELRRRLVGEAFALVESRHARSVVSERIREVFGARTGSTGSGARLGGCRRPLKGDDDLC